MFGKVFREISKNLFVKVGGINKNLANRVKKVLPSFISDIQKTGVSQKNPPQDPVHT